MADREALKRLLSIAAGRIPGLEFTPFTGTGRALYAEALDAINELELQLLERRHEQFMQHLLNVMLPTGTESAE